MLDQQIDTKPPKVKRDFDPLTPEEVYALAKEKGWWDQPRSFDALMALVHSEISEGVEGWRNNIAPDAKGNLGEELADAAIRMYDLSVGLGIPLDRGSVQSVIMPEGALEQLNHVHVALARATTSQPNTNAVGAQLSIALCLIRQVAEAHGYDLERCMRNKHEFNKTRPYRHGGKKA